MRFPVSLLQNRRELRKREYQMIKEELLKHWAKLRPNQNPLPLMEAMSYKKKGSSFGCSGIRIDGSPQFIDAVLSNLKPLLEGEGIATRLVASRMSVKHSEGYKAGENADDDSEVCYIRLQQRGREATAMNAMVKGVILNQSTFQI
jgi:hypothetical protein